MPQEIYDAAEGVLTSGGAKQLRIGNPTTTSGEFYDTHHSKRGLWRNIHISAFDSPNLTGEEVPAAVAERLVTRQWVEDRLEEWGEDSPIYQVRVLGEFPDQAEGSLIALSWVEAAVERTPEAEGAVTLGVDVARQGSCESVVYARQGQRILHMEAWRSSDLMETTGRVGRVAKQYGATSINVDGTGMGAGVVDRLAEQGYPALAVLVGSKPADAEQFAMLRDEIWWALRERIREGEIGPITDGKTQAQLSSIQYGFDSRSRIRVEAKDQMQKRGLASPDRADALCLAFYTAPAWVLTTDDDLHESFFADPDALVTLDPYAR